MAKKSDKSAFPKILTRIFSLHPACVCLCAYDVALTYEKAADRSVDLLEDVADHIKSSYKAQLQGIVDHHAYEHDVPGVLVEETRVR